MAIIKCKMCGGDIIPSEDRTYGTCDHCGSTMTFPKVSDEQRLNLFNRANHFRRQNEFDKAIAAYDKILDLDDTDAEAHWGSVLSRYGIEYVEDPVTHARIPTCHRVQLSSILADSDYLNALKHAPDTMSRSLYEAEAKRIAEIQKGILSISSREKPYDVFICYKETDDSGSRTKDSTLAQEIYYQLTNDGFKVFFSRITLEEKLGQEYEPYIFAALNSAKVMLVVGTKPEHFNAVWVKNEWSRYLALMRHDRSKLLIPCYRDMDPYDLPEELSALQSQDMGKIGFMQDLIRGVKKVLRTEEAKPQTVQQPMAVPTASTTPLLKRAFMFLEDGEFAKADGFCEQVLNLDPENAMAYLGKLMAELQVHIPEELKNQPQPFDGMNNYHKVMRFGDDALKMQVRGYIDSINERNETARCEEIYQRGIRALETAETPEACEEAKNIFASIPGYRDADAKQRECEDKANSIIYEKTYEKAINALLKADTPEGCRTIGKMFASISGYRDADAKQIECRERAAVIQRAEDEADEIRRTITAQITAYESEMAVQQRLKAAVSEAERTLNHRSRELAEEETKLRQAQSKLSSFEAELRNLKGLFTGKRRRELEKEISETQYVISNIGRNLESLKQNARTAEEKLQQAKASCDIGQSQVVFVDSREINYQCGKHYLEYGLYTKALGQFRLIHGYKDVEKLITSDNNFSAAYKAEFAVGKYVSFGSYPQTASGMDSTPIEWLVLARDGNKALLLSRYGLDVQPYNIEFTEITWEKCTLRAWLNSTFLNKAFTSVEQSAILATNVDNGSGQGYGEGDASGGNDTQDKVFLLSYAEANQYLSVTFDDKNNMKSRISPTAYAKTKGAFTGTWETSEGAAAVWWWLRSPGYIQSSAALVLSVGSLHNYIVSRDSCCVRPAFWLNLESGIF